MTAMIDPQPISLREADTARARLMSEALRIFARDGFDGASTRVIAKAAGVNHSLIPYHFGSKDGLWRETMAEVLEAFGASLMDVSTKKSGQSAAERLRVLIRAFVVFCAERPEFHRVLTAEWAQGAARIRWLGETHIKPVSDMAIKLIASAQKEGAVVAGDPVRLHYAMIGASVTAFAMAPEYKMLCGRDPRTPNGIEETVRIVERMLLSP